MDREEFKSRLKQYKKAREENPGLKYWEWRSIPKYDEGGSVMGPVTWDEWIKQHRKKPNIVENEDDEKLIQLIREKAKNFQYLRNLTNEQGIIPFIEEKAIRLSNAGKDTGVRLSTNMLDSIAKYADKADIPLQDALGLAGQESTFGKGYFLDQHPITPSVLVSDWNYSDDLLSADRTENPYIGLMRTAQRKYDSGGYDESGRFMIYNPDYIKALQGGLPFADKEAKRLRTDIPVLEHAFKKFKSGKYNPGDPNHTQMVKDRGEALMQSPEIQKWINENNIKYAQGGVAENGEDEKETAIPTQEEYIAQQIAAKRAAALDKSRNRTSIRVPMINNPQSEEQWKKSMDERIRITEEQLSKSMATGDLEMAEFLQSALDNLLNQKYIPVVAGFNCMYNAGDCYGLNIPSNQVFAAKHKELGFEKTDKDNLEPGDLVQDIKGRIPVHAMIYDSKDSEGNLLFNYAKGHTDSLADDMGYNYAKQGKYPMKNYDVYKYVGTPADSTQWINDYKKIYGFAEGGEVKLNPYTLLWN